MRTTLKHTKTNTITRNQLEQVFACAICGQLHGHKIIDRRLGNGLKTTLILKNAQQVDEQNLFCSLNTMICTIGFYSAEHINLKITLCDQLTKKSKMKLITIQ